MITVRASRTRADAAPRSPGCGRACRARVDLQSAPNRFRSRACGFPKTRLRYRFLDRGAKPTPISSFAPGDLRYPAAHDRVGVHQFQTPICLEAPRRGARDYLCRAACIRACSTRSAGTAAVQAALMVAGLTGISDRALFPRGWPADRSPGSSTSSTSDVVRHSEDVWRAIEPCCAACSRSSRGRLSRPRRSRAFFDEAMKYGTDKPDL